MSAAAQPVPEGQQQLEDKITAAAAKASEIVAMFAPGAAAAIQAGVAVEPVVSGMVKLFVHMFHHHVKQ